MSHSLGWKSFLENCREPPQYLLIFIGDTITIDADQYIPVSTCTELPFILQSQSDFILIHTLFRKHYVTLKFTHKIILL